MPQLGVLLAHHSRPVPQGSLTLGVRVPYQEESRPVLLRVLRARVPLGDARLVPAVPKMPTCGGSSRPHSTIPSRRARSHAAVQGRAGLGLSVLLPPPSRALNSSPEAQASLESQKPPASRHRAPVFGATATSPSPRPHHDCPAFTCQCHHLQPA